LTSGTDTHPGASFTALIVQDCLFRSPQWAQRLTNAAEDYVLVRFPDRLDNLIHCCSRFETSVAIVEKTLLVPPITRRFADMIRSGTSVRIICKVDGTESQESLERLLLAGCYGFVTDKVSCASLKRVIRGVNDGQMVVTRKLLSRVLQGLLSGKSLPKLSPREHDVLCLLGQRLSNKKIAEQLFISEETLRWHLRNLYAKTEVRTRNELVEYAAALFREKRCETEPGRTSAAAPKALASGASGWS
jgi:DNA-binding CsgD family transcriptional regulator